MAHIGPSSIAPHMRYYDSESASGHHHHHHRHPNDTCDSFAPGEILPNPYRLIFSISIAVTALVTLLLNLFVIVTIVLNDKPERKGKKGVGGGQEGRVLRTNYTNTHLSFISLSIAVIIYSSICVPGMFLQTIDNHNKSNFFIRVLIFGFYVSPIASSFMHLLMAFDRYLAIKSCFNFRRYWYQRHYLLCIVLLWAVSILIIVPLIWYKKFSTDVQFTITLIRLLFTFSIPSLLTLTIYLSLAYELTKVNRQEVEELQLSLMRNKQTIIKHRKIILKILILAFTHFLCWFPFSVVESLNDLFPDLFHRCSSDIHMHIYYRLMAVLILITSMTGIFYPCMYCFVSKEFRRLFKRHLWSFCGVQQISVNNNSSISEDNTSLATQKTELSTKSRTKSNASSNRKKESQV